MFYCRTLTSPLALAKCLALAINTLIIWSPLTRAWRRMQPCWSCSLFSALASAMTCQKPQSPGEMVGSFAWQHLTRYLDENPDLPCAVSLRLLTFPAGREGAALVWREGQGLALGPYCACQGDPRVWGEVLQFLLEQENTPKKHESVDSLLMAMAAALPPATLGPLLPPGEQFQSCLAESKKAQQADRLQGVIIQTGCCLLDSLALWL